MQQKYGLAPGQVPEIYLRDPKAPAPEKYRILCDADFPKYSSWEHDRNGGFWGRKLRDPCPTVVPTEKRPLWLNASDVSKKGEKPSRDRNERKKKRDERSRRHTLRGATRTFSDFTLSSAVQETARFSHTGIDSTYDPKGNVSSNSEVAVCSVGHCRVRGHYYRQPFSGAERRKQEAKNKLPKQGKGDTKKPPILCSKVFADECKHDCHFHDLEQLKNFGLNFEDDCSSVCSEHSGVRNMVGNEKAGLNGPHKDLHPTHFCGGLLDAKHDDDCVSSTSDHYDVPTTEDEEDGSGDPHKDCSPTRFGGGPLDSDSVVSNHSEPQDPSPPSELVAAVTSDSVRELRRVFTALKHECGPDAVAPELSPCVDVGRQRVSRDPNVHDSGCTTIVSAPESNTCSPSLTPILDSFRNFLKQKSLDDLGVLCETRTVNIFLAGGPRQHQYRWRKLFFGLIPFVKAQPLSIDSCGPFPATINDVTDATKGAFRWRWQDRASAERVYGPTCKTNVDLMPEIYQSSYTGLIFVRVLQVLFTGDPNNRELYHRSLLNPDGAVNAAFPGACRYYLSQQKEFDVWCRHIAADGTSGMVIIENTISHYINQRAFEYLRSRNTLPTLKVVPTFRFSGQSPAPSRSGPFFAFTPQLALMRQNLSLINAGGV